MNNFVGQFNLSEEFNNFYNLNSNIGYKNINNIDIFNNILNSKQIAILHKEINSISWVPVGIDGYLKNFNGIIGSYRASVYDQTLADYFFNTLKEYLNPNLILNEYATTDWDFHSNWKFVGINPLFRFIKYENNGILVPHYDASFIYNNEKRTLKSLVIYLTTNNSGKTRFLNDQQINIPYQNRNFEDQFFKPLDKDIYFENSCIQGNAISFNHRLLHDSSMIDNEIKIIIRTDLVYEKI